MDAVVLTIGGSDSGGGAGIQADVKTFSALGVYGTSIVTAVTAQNTVGVKSVFGLDPEAISAQFDSLFEDFDINCIKTGMLYSKETVSIVADWLEDTKAMLVLDPVLEAEAGGKLLRPEAFSAMKEELIPLARVVTPNIFEAQAITGINVKDLESAKLAASRIVDMGGQAAIVTGGHLNFTDVLFEDDKVHLIEGKRVDGGTHGVGCTYSAALTSFLARNWPLKDSALAAKQFAIDSIAYSHAVGRGASPVNQFARPLQEANRFRAITDIYQALDRLADEPNLWRFIPEVGCNIGMAIPSAVGTEDIVAVEGRLIRAGKKVHQSGCPRFGASSHIARIILAAMKFDKAVRSAMNLRLSKQTLDICKDLGLAVASFDRKNEPPGSKTMSWGTEKAILNAGFVPDIIWDSGGPGKEPMIRLLGKSATSVADSAIRIAKLADAYKV
jgi:hydroxymethylpyrimidine kinase/phosphomethylpyrimidine kinase